MKALLVLATATALLLSSNSAGAADKQAKTQTNRDCFSSRDWAGWSAPNDGDTLYLRINNRQIYQVDLTPGTHVRRDADDFLVNEVRGSNWICSAIDLDLTLADREGFRQRLIARSLRKLTPEEAAAIPPKDLP